MLEMRELLTWLILSLDQMIPINIEYTDSDSWRNKDRELLAEQGAPIYQGSGEKGTKV
jgi:hypothetical protein